MPLSRNVLKTVLILQRRI